MLKLNVHVILRFVLGSVVALAFGLSPQLAIAETPGALAELASSPASGSGLNGTQDVVVSPDGNNVYSIGATDDAITEFARNADGSLTQVGCIADVNASGSTCATQTAIGLENPQAIAISPDGKNVYVAAETSDAEPDIAEFTRNPDGSLTPVSGNDCIAETGDAICDVADAHGLGVDEPPNALAVSPKGNNVYVGDEQDQAVATLTRNPANGSLTEPGGAADCIQDGSVDSGDCSNTGRGLSEVTGVAVSPDGADVYTVGAPNPGTDGSIAAFSVGAGGTLTQIGCLGNAENAEECGNAIGIVGISGLLVSPDGNNVYTASQFEGGPIAEFSRGADGTLRQLSSPNDCIEEQGVEYNFTCASTGVGIGSGYRLAISPDGANVYAAAPIGGCSSQHGCSDVAEFARDGTTGALTQLAAPDSCIQDSSVVGSECPNENGTGLGGPGVAISPDGNNVYVTGSDGIAEFARGTHTLTVSLGGTGNGSVADDTGAIACPTECSATYQANSQVTLTAAPASGSTFTGWSGACSGTGTCQLRMNADMAVTATFTANVTPPPATPPPPGAPTPVVTGAPTAVTDAGAGFTGSVNPEGLPTNVYFQYGLDKRYSAVGASGPNYTQQTAGQLVGPDFTTHGIGPVAVSGLLPNAVYHVRLVATNSAGTAIGQDVAFKTELAPLPGPPTFGQTFDIAPVSGVVFVVIHGQLVPLTQPEQIGQGTVIDSLHGTFELVIAPGGTLARDAAARGKVKTQTGRFGGAVVRLHQATSGRSRGLTTVMMIESAFKGSPSQAICRAPGATPDASAAKLNTKTIQLLHASAHGKFATSGRYSAATVQGTVWTIIARCDGTLVHAIKDEVVVTDFVRHKTIVLHAGQSYLAPGPRKK
jgi:DNA-binding beta-propeller fold protein YncE